ncbi:hypothetical protein C8Q70DRAFT_271076 [Cubamyces menziesii]|nr:hypothetical protein C8Q70DRAFT_271076 [Cubamyces menziesii]
MHAFILLPVLASITAALAHSKGLQSRQLCTSDCVSSSVGSLSAKPAWLISCLRSAGCPDPVNVCSDVDNVKACVSSNTHELNQMDPVSFVAFVLRNCSNTDSTATRK